MSSKRKKLVSSALKPSNKNIYEANVRRNDFVAEHNYVRVDQPSTSNINHYENSNSDSESDKRCACDDEYEPDSSCSGSTNSSDFENKEQETINNKADHSTASDSTFETESLENQFEEEPEESDQLLEPNKTKKKHFPLQIKTSRKRKRNETQWVRKKAALNRNNGQKYNSYNGVVVNAKNVGMCNLCTENCRLNCSNQFEIQQRNKILTSFYKLDINGKNALLFSNINGSSPERKKKITIKRRTASYQYFVTIEGKQILVCKKAFASLYQISNKKIEIIQKKIKIGGAAPSPDRRGRHSNRPNKIKDEIKDYLMKHISSFPAESSHYSRASNINKKYLSPLLSLPKMHSLYLELCTTEKKPEMFHIKECYYRSIFVNEFNLSFAKPKSYTCSTCDAGNSNEGHIENYHTAFESMKMDRELAQTSDNVVYITIDLQQTMPLPRLTTSKAFYLRQLWFYNFGIHIVAKNVDKSTFCTWTENQGSKGSIEIFSSLLTVLETDETLKSKDHLIIWSDSCGGQNKNFLIICLYQYLVSKKMFKVIDHKYPEVGHTYLDSDRDFGRIEKNLRKHETLFTPDQYKEIISKSSKKNLVIDMTNHFREAKNFVNDMKLYNRKTDVRKIKIRFRDGIKWFRIDTYGSYMFKECYDYYTPFQQVNIIRDINTELDIDNVVILRDPNKKNPVSKEKIDNLKEQLRYIPKEHQWFYHKIITEYETVPRY